MVYSSSFIFAQERTGDGYAFIKKQVVFTLLGFIALAVGFKVDYRKMGQWAYAILGSMTAVLLFVMIPGVGHRAGGAQRWLNLGFFQVQPAEIAKLALILFVAKQLERKTDRLNSFTAGVLSQFLLILPALTLLLLQPDFGSTVIISMVVFGLMFVAGVPGRFLGGTLMVGAVSAAAMIFSSSYRYARLMTFMDPWRDPAGKGFQILQSLVGLNNGSLLGVGLGNGKEKLFYLPEAHNDFIFAVIGEELGFLGVACVTLAFSFFVYRGLKIGWNSLNEKSDRFGFLLATGISLMIGLQAFVNMSVVLGLLPTKGLPLPFISYGGSSIIMNLFAVGILLGISRSDRTRENSPQVMA